jgi:hypothetical protein
MDPQIEQAKPSVDAYELPCGYVDPEGTVHTSVVVSEMTGEDEETLAAKNMTTTKKINKILIRCTQSVGTLSGQQLNFVIPELTQGDRIFLLMAIRRASLGDEMPFETTCPQCKEAARFIVDLKDLGVKKMANPAQRTYPLTLPKTKKKVLMKVLTGRGEEAIAQAVQKSKDIITTAIFARVESIDDKPIVMKDLLSLPLIDRNFLRNSWEDNEGGVDTSIQVDCPSCNNAYDSELDISQQGFFNPSATLSNWKKKYSF